MLVPDMAVDMIIFDGFTKVVQDGVTVGNRLPGPGFESITEGIQVAVGADTRIGVLTPGTAKRRLGVQNHKALFGTLLPQVVRRTNTGNTGTYNQHINVLASAAPLGNRCNSFTHEFGLSINAFSMVTG